MAKSFFILLGNGFTIDFINQLDKGDQIDVTNLFLYGDCVPWPGDNEPGFLSHKRCPNLWRLGARPNMRQKDAQRLIEDIITCANIATQSEYTQRHVDDTYIFAYQELTTARLNEMFT